MVGNFWADVLLRKNACSLKLSGAGDVDFDFFLHLYFAVDDAVI